MSDPLPAWDIQTLVSTENGLKPSAKRSLPGQANDSLRNRLYSEINNEKTESYILVAGRCRSCPGCSFNHGPLAHGSDGIDHGVYGRVSIQPDQHGTAFLRCAFDQRTPEKK